MADRYCGKCNKTMSEQQFYTYKNKEKCEICKACLTMHINNWEPSTYVPILQKFDVPYIPEEWNVLRDRAYQKDPYKMTGMSVIGKYLSKMRIKPWNAYGWNDTEMLQKKAEKRAKAAGQDEVEAKLNNVKEAYENGELTEEQYLMYKKIETPTIGAGMDAQGPQNANPSIYPVNNHPYEEVELPDFGKDLTQDDKIYYAIKWGQFYTVAEWITLENLYEEFKKTFTIQGAARIDTLKQICKLSLKMNQALDSGDYDTYSKLAKAYDAMMKSAKFTEAQNKESTEKEFDSIGQIVLFAESKEGGGSIMRHDISTPHDIVDEALVNLKKYLSDLIKNDSTLSQQIENYLKRRIASEEQKEDDKKAKEQGLEHYEVTDENFVDFHSFVAEESEKDFVEEE